MIKKFYITKPKEGYQLDRRTGQYYSWGYDIWLQGVRRQARGFLSKPDAEEAVRQLKQREKEHKLGLLPSAKVPYLIELFQRKLDTMAGADRARAKRVFKDFLALLPKGIKVPELKTAHVQLYYEKRQKAGVSGSTIKRECVPIISALNSADVFFSILEGYRPPKLPKLKIDKTRRTVTIGFDERRRLFEYLFAPRFEHERYAQMPATRRRTGLFLQFCLLTVSRPGEAAALKRSDVDLHAKMVRIAGTKTKYKTAKAVRHLGITATMEAILRERMAEANGEYLFTPGGVVTPRMRETLKQACEAAGLNYGKNALDGIVFYTARHTATTELIRSGVDVRTAGRFTGHSDESMTLYYSHGDAESLERASNVLEESMGDILQRSENLETKAKTASEGSD